MLSPEHQEILKEAHRRWHQTKNMQHINDAIELVKSLAPEKFFREGKTPDPLLARRVFVHQPYSGHWSGTARTNKRAW